MKKLDFFKYAAILAAFFVVLFVTGCGDNVNPDIDGNGNPDDNSGNNPGSITIPTEPPSVSGGSLTKTGGEPVTRTNLYDFIEVFRSALDKHHSSRGVRALPEEYYREGEGGKSYYTIRDENEGRLEITEEGRFDYYETATSESITEYGIATYKYFDFSNSGELFLGGAVGCLYIEISDSYIYTFKINGIINFAGKYKGKVVFENVVVTFENMPYDGDGSITKGNFYVESDGEKNDLPVHLFYELDRYDTDSKDYGNDPITITMPPVPNVTGGGLNNHTGNNHTVNSENVNEFFSAVIEELSNAGPRAVNEGYDMMESLKHGRLSGYYLAKYDDIGQYNNSEDKQSATQKVEYHDYSNKGVLYFGGGIGQASFDIRGENVIKTTRETIIKGTVKFNGKFKGEIVFNDFEYKYEYGSGSGSSYNTHVSGSVKIGTLDISDEYMREVIR